MTDQPDSSKRRKWALLATALALPVVAYLAFVVFGVQTLFVNKTVDEAGPEFSSQASPAPESDAAESADAESETTATPDSDQPDSSQPDSGESENVGETAGEIATLAQGSFVDRAHPSAGVASVLGDGSEQRFLRFESFETDNGPDLFVYLTSADASADDEAFGAEGEFVNLGSLKGNIGDQNYEIPVDTDLDRFKTVVIWCRRFGVAFGAADLA